MRQSMRETRILYFALGVLLVVSVGAVSLHDTGVEFPDGSFQTSAAGFTAKTAIQGKVFLTIFGTSFCTSWTTLYPVSSGQRLVIEWVGAETSIAGGALTTHPADVEIRTYNGSGTITHPFARLVFPDSIGPSFFTGTFFHAMVRLYSEGGEDVDARICLNQQVTDEGVGSVSFSGYLVDVP